MPCGLTVDDGQSWWSAISQTVPLLRPEIGMHGRKTPRTPAEAEAGMAERTQIQPAPTTKHPRSVDIIRGFTGIGGFTAAATMGGC